MGGLRLREVSVSGGPIVNEIVLHGQEKSNVEDREIAYLSPPYKITSFILSSFPLWDMAPNVWLHSSVGRALHWYSLTSQVQIPLKSLIFFFQAYFPLLLYQQLT